MQDEENLVRQAQKLDGEAFARLYEGYFDKIFRYIVLKVGNQMEAEDITQQVFVNALRAMPFYKWRGTPFSAWLFRIAHNQIVDYLRKKTKHQTTSLDGPGVIATECDDPIGSIERRLDVEELHQAMQQLNEAQREVISLRFSGDLPIAEVARIMGRSEGAIKALQHSAVIALRKVMSTGVAK